MNGSSAWIEPPPRRHEVGCFAKGCLILVVFFILLGCAFVAGYYFAQRHDYFSSHPEPLPTSRATVEEENEVRARWDSFEKAAQVNKFARIELSADNINALIASELKLRGNAYVTIDDTTAHLQTSMPLAKGRWFRGRYLNAQCLIQSSPSGKPEDVRITSIIINGKPVGEEVLNWRYGELPPFKKYVADWTGQRSLQTFEIADGRVVLQTKGTKEDPFACDLSSPSPTSTP
jgi:hypothetical protein